MTANLDLADIQGNILTAYGPSWLSQGSVFAIPDQRPRGRPGILAGNTIPANDGYALAIGTQSWQTRPRFDTAATGYHERGT